jgi:hypothetical protein
MSKRAEFSIESECGNNNNHSEISAFDLLCDRNVYSSSREATPDSFASHQKREPYPGYYERVAEERGELNDALTGVFGPIEKEAGFLVGCYGIYGSYIKTRRKWLEPPRWLVKSLPTVEEEKALGQLSTRLKGLAAGNTREAAAIVRQAATIENQVLSRSRLHALGGLTVGLAVSHACDRMFFKHDTLGNGSATADLLAAPMLAWRMPGNLLTKAAAVVAVELVGKLADHFSQTKYSDTYHAKRSSSMQAPSVTPLPKAMFSSEDIHNQNANRARQQAEIDTGTGPQKRY